MTFDPRTISKPTHQYLNNLRTIYQQALTENKINKNEFKNHLQEQKSEAVQLYGYISSWGLMRLKGKEIALDKWDTTNPPTIKKRATTTQEGRREIIECFFNCLQEISTTRNLGGEQGLETLKNLNHNLYLGLTGLALTLAQAPLPEIDSRDKYTQDETKKNKLTNNQTKLQILQFAADKSRNYPNRLRENNKRTELIAGKDNTFIAECPYRIRVGGETGTENILLPAFDSFGIPYIPSSSLRGVARSQAFWEISQEYINDLIIQHGTITHEQIKQIKQRTEQEVSTYFGSLDVVEQHRMGKVIFLDAYPFHSRWGLQGKSLALDIATNIWGWEGNEPKYSPNPNAFLSLNQPEFLIGLRLLPRVSREIFDKVKGWLIRGLQNGIGSQVNSGYGEMIIQNGAVIVSTFLKT